MGHVTKKVKQIREEREVNSINENLYETSFISFSSMSNILDITVPVLMSKSNVDPKDQIAFRRLD